MGGSSSRTAYVVDEEGKARVVHAFKKSEQFAKVKRAMAAKVYGDRATRYSPDFIQLLARTGQGDFAIGNTSDVPHDKDTIVVVKLLPGGATESPVLALPSHQGTFKHRDDVIDDSKAPEVSRTHDDTDKLFPIVVLGHTGAGKTALIQRFRSDVFSFTHITTIGMSADFVTLNIGDVVIKIRITDTAGQKRFQAVSNSHIPSARGAIIVFDVCDRESYEEAKQLIANLKQLNPALLKQGLVLLVAAKIDRESLREISTEEAAKAADAAGLYYFETSARDGVGIHPPFHFLATKLLTKYPTSLAGLRTPEGTGSGATSGSRCTIM